MLRRLLVITQVMDDSHPILGFFASWIRGWKDSFASLSVLALQVDPRLMIDGVSVTSLGKEAGSSKWERLTRLWRTAWHARKTYDTVFVHMNEEYVVLCGWFWRLMGKRVILWRNHPIGTWKTPIAAFFAHELMYTSPQSYVARYAHARQMPAGIPYPEVCEYARKSPGMIVMAGRIAEWYKRTHLLVEAGVRLSEDTTLPPWTIDIIGDPDAGEQAYYERLKTQVQERGLETRIRFTPGKPYREILNVYRQADIVVNTTQSGSFDKALLEAMALGCIPLTSNEALREVLPHACVIEEDSSEALYEAIRQFLLASPEECNACRDQARAYIAKRQSFAALATQLAERINA